MAVGDAGDLFGDPVELVGGDRERSGRALDQSVRLRGEAGRAASAAAARGGLGSSRRRGLDRSAACVLAGGRFGRG